LQHLHGFGADAHLLKSIVRDDLIDALKRVAGSLPICWRPRWIGWSPGWSVLSVVTCWH